MPSLFLLWVRPQSSSLLAGVDAIERALSGVGASFPLGFVGSGYSRMARSFFLFFGKGWLDPTAWDVWLFSGVLVGMEGPFFSFLASFVFRSPSPRGWLHGNCHGFKHGRWANQYYRVAEALAVRRRFDAGPCYVYVLILERSAMVSSALMRLSFVAGLLEGNESVADQSCG